MPEVRQKINLLFQKNNLYPHGCNYEIHFYMHNFTGLILLINPIREINYYKRNWGEGGAISNYFC